MGSDVGNPQIAEHGKVTRFAKGGRNCPVAAQRRALPPWSVRRALQRLLAETFDLNEPITRRRLCRVFCPRARYVTGAQAAAIALFLAALQDYRAMNKVLRITEGHTF